MLLKEMLTAAGYSLMANGAWMREGYAGIAYSDGDASEQGLEAVVRAAQDVGVFSSELAAACVDWPSRYHLSTERANLLRPFSAYLQPGIRVLEVGAGCGAVTRYLGETGAQVLALEGSVRRAGIARLRTRNLSNVEVVAERFQDFHPSEKFDVVTLVGVLEYASLFEDGADSARRMLTSMRGMMAPGGRLLVAIENQLGLKYLAGVPEDHLGEPMAGVEDRYPEVGPRTFGRHALKKLLAAADFPNARFFVPLPDYKMPASILTEAGALAEPEYFDAGALAAQAVRRDPQLTPTSFNLQRAWPVVARNQLGIDLANSFLVEAQVDEISANSEDVLAYHYSTQRVGAFARETRFLGAIGKPVRVTSKALSAGPAARQVGGIRLRVQADSPYYNGHLLVEEIRAVLTQPGWTLEALAVSVKGYLAGLREVLAADGFTSPLSRLDEALPDEYLDASPSNLIRKRDGSVAYIDREWQVAAPPLGWILVRGLMFAYAGTTVAARDDVSTGSLRDLLLELLARIDLPCSDSSFDEYVAMELEFQVAVTGKDQAEAINGMLAASVPSATALATDGPAVDMAAAFATLQHSLNLGAQHGMNLHAMLESLHGAFGATLAQFTPALDRIQARTTELADGQAALHERMVTLDDRLNDTVAHWSVEQSALTANAHADAAAARSAVEDVQIRVATLADQTMQDLRNEIIALRASQESLMGRLARPWWKRW